MKIAVVDDNESERTKLCTLLREWGEKRKYEMVCNEFTDGKDFTTCEIAKHILAMEEEHEQDLQDYLTDIARMKSSFLNK